MTPPRHIVYVTRTIGRWVLVPLALWACVGAVRAQTKEPKNPEAAKTDPAATKATHNPSDTKAAGANQGPGVPKVTQDLEAARSAVSKWVGTQQILFKERKDWQEEKEILRARIELVRKEIQELDQKSVDLRHQVADSDRRKVESASETGTLKSMATSLGQTIGELETEIRRLHRSLPGPVQEKVAPLYQRIPDAGVEAKVSVAERFQNVLGILNEVNRVNSEITLASEIRQLSDGKPSEVKTVYVGLAQAYFISASGEAGVGHPSENGWRWEHANELAANIGEIIEILQNKSRARFVPLPVRIQ